MTPEHIHLATNHIPVLGAGFAILPLLWGLLRRNRGLLLCGLVMAAVSGWVTPVVMSTGESAYERYEHGAVSDQLDPDVAPYLHAHEERAHTWSKVMYITAVLATAGLVASGWRRDVTRWLSGAVVVSCVVSVGAGVWIAESGGTIRRPDFRAPSSIEEGTQNQSVDHRISSFI